MDSDAIWIGYGTDVSAEVSASIFKVGQWLFYLFPYITVLSVFPYKATVKRPDKKCNTNNVMVVTVHNAVYVT
jgi:hypothetical protein